VSGPNGRTCGEDVAAYVLGALEPEEADAFRRHIAACETCREEVAEFQSVTEALPPGAGGRYEVPKDLRRRVMREVRASPKAGAARQAGAEPARVPAARLWRPFTAWAGAVAVVAVAVIVAVAISSGGSSGTRTIQASVGSAELRIAGGRGDLVVHRLPPPPAGRIYEMWVQRGNAAPTPTGTLFSTRSNGSASVGVPGSLNRVSRVLVTQEPAGGTPVPTSAPVIVAPVT
jgi:anti-sigma-K factor RskA